MLRKIGLLFCLVALSLCASAEESVIMESFENAWTGEVPPGWETDGGKAPAGCYAQDLKNPHGGQACFRISHPASASYCRVNLSPARIPTAKGMIYAVSFWARADKPGAAQLEWQALESFSPYKDTPSRGSLELELDGNWREFKISLREGQDFFAEEARYIVLFFSAVSNSNDSRTMWLDDLSVSKRQDPNPTGMLCERTIPYEALKHRLAPGESLEFTVDAEKRVRRTSRYVGGVSFWRVFSQWADSTGAPFDSDKGHYTLAPLESAIKDLKLPGTRFYAVGDKPFGIDKGIDLASEALRRMEMPEERCILELEPQHADVAFSPEEWASGVKRSLEKGYKFHYWEISNEPYSGIWGDKKMGGAFPSPEAYVTHFKEVSAAVRAADPQAKIGLNVYGIGNDPRWDNYLLKELAGTYDFVAPHYYFWANLKTKPFEEVVLTGNYKTLDKVLREQALIRAYNPGREVVQYDTEWGVLGHQDGEEEGFDVRTANIMGTMHMAVRLIHYAREETVQGASAWCLIAWIKKLANSFLTLGAPDKRCMAYWLFYYFNRHLGEWALDIEGTAPYYKPLEASDRAKFGGPQTPVLATLSEDGGRLFLVVANGSWSKPAPCLVRLKNFNASSSSGVLLTNDDLDRSPLLDKKEDAIKDLPLSVSNGELKCVIPPHSVAFISLERAK